MVIDAAALELSLELGPGYWGKRASPRRTRERLIESDPGLLEKGWFVATLGDRVVGVMALATRPFRAWKKQLWARPDQPALGVFDVAVDPAVQGRGIGRALMEFAEARAAAMGLPWVRLDAFAANPGSNAFYRRIGYVARGTVRAADIELVLYEKAIATSSTSRGRRAPRAPRSS